MNLTMKLLTFSFLARTLLYGSQHIGTQYLLKLIQCHTLITPVKLLHKVPVQNKVCLVKAVLEPTSQ